MITVRAVREVVLPLYIPLGSAYLCQDCNCVSNWSRRCPACASEVLLNLGSVLDRETDGPAGEFQTVADKEVDWPSMITA